jgi:signal transduction histidine kinase
VRDCLAPIVIDKASEDARYSGHRTPKMYGFESYIAVPIFRSNGEYFGNLCGLDPRPARLSDEKTVAMVTLFAELISVQLDAEEEHAERQIALLDERQTAELREQFIAVLGHDLRNPLSAISFGAEALRRMPIDATALSIVERMQRSCRRISRLVEDVLDFARGRLGGSIPLETRPVGDLERDLQHVVAEHRDTHPNRVIQ